MQLSDWRRHPSYSDKQERIELVARVAIGWYLLVLLYLSLFVFSPFSCQFVNPGMVDLARDVPHLSSYTAQRSFQSAQLSFTRLAFFSSSHADFLFSS